MPPGSAPESVFSSWRGSAIRRGEERTLRAALRRGLRALRAARELTWRAVRASVGGTARVIDGGVMYCAACRTERAGTAQWCVLCGRALIRRERIELERDLAAVRFVLLDLDKWDSQKVGVEARKF